VLLLEAAQRQGRLKEVLALRRRLGRASAATAESADVGLGLKPAGRVEGKLELRHDAQK
jgi:hypothetical protein